MFQKYESKVATSQFKAIKGDFDANLNKAISLVEKASKENVDILLLQELFQDYYFCSTKMINFLILQLITHLIQCLKNYLTSVKKKKFHYQLAFFKRKKISFLIL